MDDHEVYPFNEATMTEGVVFEEQDSEVLKDSEVLEDSEHLDDSEDDQSDREIEATKVGYEEESEDESEDQLPFFLEDFPLFHSELLDQKIYDGSQVSLKEAVFMLLKWQSDNEVSLEALKDQLKIISVLLPQPNCFPTSIHALHKLIGVDLNKYKEHVCINDCYLFPKIKQSDWRDHKDDTCPKCNSKRFKQGKKTPHKSFFRLTLKEQIENLTKNPNFNQSLEKMKKEIEDGLTCNESFWGSELCRKAQGSVSFLDDFSCHFLLSIGLDGVQCFKSSKYSVWPVCVKIWNLHPEERTSRDYILLTALIPGIYFLFFIFYFLFFLFFIFYFIFYLFFIFVLMNFLKLKFTLFVIKYDESSSSEQNSLR